MSNKYYNYFISIQIDDTNQKIYKIKALNRPLAFKHFILRNYKDLPLTLTKIRIAKETLIKPPKSST